MEGKASSHRVPDDGAPLDRERGQEPLELMAGVGHPVPPRLVAHAGLAVSWEIGNDDPLRDGERARDFVPRGAISGEAVEEENRVPVSLPVDVGDDEVAIDRDPMRPHAAPLASSVEAPASQARIASRAVST